MVATPFLYCQNPLRSEFYLGGVLCALLSFKIGLGVETVDITEDVAGELAQVGVVAACHLVEIAALYGNAVLRALELCLQLLEVLVGLEVGVGFTQCDEAAQRTAYLALCLLVGL